MNFERPPSGGRAFAVGPSKGRANRMAGKNLEKQTKVTGKRAALSEYCRAICECAGENGCRVIDLYQPENAYETIDDLHPDRRGMKTLAETVLLQLNAWEE